MVRKINLDQISRKKVAGERLVYVEISNLQEYEKIQIAGAIGLPLEKVRELAPQYLPNRGAVLVVYGPERDSRDALRAAELLDEMGYGNVYFYPGGKEEWTRVSLDIESVHYPPPPPTVPEYARPEKGRAGPPARVIKPAA